MFRCCLWQFRATTIAAISRCEACYYVTLGHFRMPPGLLNNTIRNSRLVPFGSLVTIQPNLSLSNLLYLRRCLDTFWSWHPNTTLFSLVISTLLLIVDHYVSNSPINTARTVIGFALQKDMLLNFTLFNVFQVAFTWLS